MKHIVTKFFGAFVLAATLLTVSCTTSESVDADEIEQEIFDEWIAKYRPDLLENYQEDGGYYIDLITAGDTSTRAISDTVCWVEYNMTGYDLHNNVCITRSGEIAWWQGTYTDYTHYVPYYRISDTDEDAYAVLECTQLAFRNSLKIGDDEDILLYNGAKFRLYAPSSIASSTGTEGSGGYEGQYTLSTLPFVCDVEVVNVVVNPLTYDEGLVNIFAMNNGGVTITPDSFDTYEDDDDDEDEEEDEDEDDDDDDDDDEDTDDEVYDPNSWTNATSNVPYLYINKYYELNYDGASFNYINPYTTTVPDSPYINGVAALDILINEALKDRFNDDDDIFDSEGEVVEIDGDATIWYICRLLDGFIVDTNIDEVTELIYGSVDSTGSAIYYNAEDDESSYISAWYYSIPKLRFGNWGAIITSSTYAYGSSGTNGDTTTSSSSSYYDYYNYYNYYNSYYSSYYSSSYYGYNYYDSSYYYDTSSTETTTTITTEILPYAPLIFQLFIEADDSDDDDDDDE
ncbi:MAG: hypothetical protein SNF93_00165 [Rikenellaceae bacterium]